MTREELVKIIDLLLPVFIDEFGYREKTHEKIADRILAAIESEREGEVVLEPVRVSDEGVISIADDYGDNETSWSNATLKPFSGKRGSLIFRPDTKGEK